ncbi:hypothetical protein [Bdellovibrio bacteriovorus]|uniref:hypothetical protein n=1 Tax=Bdellovibrio bacteriovorus TaxID=959 RepID=UPI0035A85D5C
MSFKKILPYILASLLLIFLVGMVQSPRSLIKSKSSNRQVHAQSENNDYFYLPVGSVNVSSLTMIDYASVIGKFITQNYTRVLQQTGLPLTIPFEWESPYFAAFAKKNSDSMQISIWGGMARAPGATPGALAAVLCHELGHILGGEPLQTIPGADWASAEGQSDFFAASQCLPDLLKKYPDLITNIDPQVEKLCGENRDCARTMQAGLEMMRLLQKYSYRDYVPVSLEVSEKPAADLIRNSYPSDQCRMDTYVQGALCQLGGSCRAPVCWFPEK